MKKQSIITVLSGKGGTGKTIISANLASIIAEDYDVLLIDLDYYVRGLTLLITSFAERVKSEKQIDWWKVLLASHDEYNNEFIEKEKGATTRGNMNDYIVNIKSKEDEEHGSISLLPSYYEKARPYNWLLMPVSLDILISKLRAFTERIPNRYRFIIIDTHAGSNNLNIATCLNTDYNIIVTEEDKVSLDTSTFLVHLIRKYYEDEDIPNPKKESIANPRCFFAVNKINANKEKSESEAEIKGLIKGIGSQQNVSFVCRNIPKIKEIYDTKPFITEEDGEDYKEFRYALLHLWRKITSYEDGIELNSSQEEKLKEDPFYSLY